MLSKKFTLTDYQNQPEEVKQKMARLIERRKHIEFLWAGDDEAFNILYYVIETYKEWEAMILWLCANKQTGKKLVEFFQNESPDGGGYHMGATLIISRLEGMKHSERMIKIDELQ